MTQTWTLENHGITPDANKRIKIKWVEPLQFPLVGPDLYIGIYRYLGQTLKQWVDRIADAGMSYLRLIVPANCWELTAKVTQGRSLFLLEDSGKFNLGNYNQSVVNTLVKGLTHARDLRRLTVQIDLMDNVMFHSPSGDVPKWFTYSEYAGVNNTLGYTTSDYRNSYYDSLAGAGDAGYRTALYAFYAHLRKKIGNTLHIIGDGNESPRRDASRAVLRSSGLISNPNRAYGGSDLWDPNKPLPEDDDPIFDNLAYLCLHQINIGNYQERFDRLDSILSAHPNIKVLFSTDGTLPRLTLPDMKALYEALKANSGLTGHLGGLADIKATPEIPIDSIINYWTTNVFSVGQ